MKKSFLISLFAAFLLGGSSAEAMSNKGEKKVEPATEEVNLAAEDQSVAAPADEPAKPAEEPIAAAPTAVEAPAPAAKEPVVMVAAANTQEAAPKAKPRPAVKPKSAQQKTGTPVRRTKTTKLVGTAKSVAATKEKSAAEAPQPEAKKPVKPTVSMVETKAYELFKDGNYDVAAPYFARMAGEKTFAFTDEMNFEGIDVIIKKYVDAHMAKFLVKGEFEKTVAYVSRVGEENRNKKIQSLANTIFDELKQRERKSVNIRDFKLSRYYADDEAFLLLSPGGDYVVNVDMAGARSFKSNFYKLQIKDLDFTADSAILRLSSFTLTNPENGKRYTFNSGMPNTYKVSEIEKFYTDRLGLGTPKATQAVIDTTKAIRSVVPPTPPVDTTNLLKPVKSEKKAAMAVEKSATAQQQAPAKSAESAATSGVAAEPAAPKNAAPAAETEEAKVTVQGDEMVLEN